MVVKPILIIFLITYNTMVIMESPLKSRKVIHRKYLRGPGAPRGCASSQLCKYILHGTVC